MKKRLLLVLPLAALFSGEPVSPPALQKPIPAKVSCPGYSGARRLYLLAYAKMKEEPGHSLRLAIEASGTLESCGPEAEALKKRNWALIRALCRAEERGLHRCP